MDLYDEFGNYIGPELDSDDEDQLSQDLDKRDAEDEPYGHQALIHMNDDAMDHDAHNAHDETRIVLHEDKKYYPDAEEVYPNVKTVTLDEDAQDLNEPIIKPVKVKQFSVLVNDTDTMANRDKWVNYDADFVTTLMTTPQNVRNIAVLGQLHSGKTMLMDCLVQAAQGVAWDASQPPVKYTDTRVDEQARQLSIKTSLTSLVLSDLRDKGYLFNFLDCPGHVNFSDECTTALRAADVVLLVVDAVEGVMLNTHRLIQQALLSKLPILLVINKVDRLILELKLPPQDAYFKLCHTLEDVNALIAQYSLEGVPRIRLSPELGNVCFASAIHGWTFSLLSFAHLYLERYPQWKAMMTASDLAKRLWGDWHVDEHTRALTKKKKPSQGTRSFVQFILEPLYKLYAHTLGESSEELAAVLSSLKVKLTSRELQLDAQPLLKIVLRRFLGIDQRGMATMLAEHAPSPVDNAMQKVSMEFSGNLQSQRAVAMQQCVSSSSQQALRGAPSSSGAASADPVPLTAHVVKLLNTSDGTAFLALTRIYSGQIVTGQRVQLLGEAFTADDDEDRAFVEVSAIHVGVGRFTMEVSSASAGNLVLLAGIDGPIKKSATLCDTYTQFQTAHDTDLLATFRPLSASFDNRSVMKMAIEPLIPSELPKMVEAVRRLNKSYPLLTTKVEESGEHVLLGTGELYLDCALHDLRHLYSDIEIKVADPVVCFQETCVDSSALNCLAETPNKKNVLTFLAEPLDEGLAQAIESHRVLCPKAGDAARNKQTSLFFTQDMHWDLLTAKSVWAFGPDEDSPNVMINNTLPSEVPQSLLTSVRESIVQGFKWGTREGPLCDEPIRNVKFRLLDAQLCAEPIHRGGGQIIPTARRSIYSSFLMATPRLMEPVLMVEVQAPADCVQAIYPVLARRRGHIVHDAPKAGAPFYTVKAFLPAMDSFGFETDLRSYTMGQVFCQQVFDHWAVVPGDPLDKNVILHPLEPSPPLALARDYMVKTRRRKGLFEDVSVNKYLDDVMLLKLARHEAEMGMLM